MGKNPTKAQKLAQALKSNISKRKQQSTARSASLSPLKPNQLMQPHPMPNMELSTYPAQQLPEEEENKAAEVE